MCSEFSRSLRLDASPDDPRPVSDRDLERGIEELERISLAAQATKLRWVAELSGERHLLHEEKFAWR